MTTPLTNRISITPKQHNLALTPLARQQRQWSNHRQCALPHAQQPCNGHVAPGARNVCQRPAIDDSVAQGRVGLKQDVAHVCVVEHHGVEERWVDTRSQ